MEKVITDTMAAAATPIPAEERAIKMKEEKVRIKKDFIEEKCRTLHLEIPRFKNAHEMSNDEVRFAIKESRDWKKESNEIISLWQEYLEESVSLRNEVDRQAISDAVNNLMYTINSKIECLAAKDKK